MTTVAQEQCAQAMSKLAIDLVHPTFIVSAGDNFYEDGIKGRPPTPDAVIPRFHLLDFYSCCPLGNLREPLVRSAVKC